MYAGQAILKKLNLQLFPTPLRIETLELSAEELQALTAVCETATIDTDGITISNNNGWHSAAKFFSRTEPIAVKVRALIIEVAERHTLEIAPEIKLTKYSWEASAWININKNGSFNAPHDHPGYLWSAVLYVKVPADLKGNQGQLEFLDPRNSVATTAGKITELRKYFASNVKVKPEPGMLVMFPSYLKHWVYPHESPEDRISIAINLRLKDRQ